MITIGAASVSKKRNSTKQWTPTATYSVSLKNPCSKESPVFVLNAGDFPYNVVKWGSDFYFVDDVTYLNNNLIQVTCTLDVLATYKSYITGSTFFVSYSSDDTNDTWLADTRIPMKQSYTIQENTVALPFAGSSYVLSTVGKNGCVSYVFNSADPINRVLNAVNAGALDQINSTLQGLVFDDVQTGLESLTEALVKTGVIGNAFENAPACIRSCHFVPFSSAGQTGESSYISLGYYNTDVAGSKLIPTANTIGSVSINIPLRYNDWRTALFEEVYLFLPYVGVIAIEASRCVGKTLEVIYSESVCSGQVAYQLVLTDGVTADTFGSYGATCIQDYAIGINQAASAGQIATTVGSGIVKTVAAGIVGSVAGAAAAVGKMAYEVADQSFTTTPSSIGGIGGNAATGLQQYFVCTVVSHDLTQTKAQIAATMGHVTMTQRSLSGLSGYTQCANASIDCPAHGEQLDEINRYLNTGFYIE